MKFIADGGSFDFRHDAKQRSKLLATCAADTELYGGADEQEEIIVPLQREWLQLWDSDQPVEQLTQEQLLGVVKARALMNVHSNVDGPCPVMRLVSCLGRG